jgi:ATP-dependent DNA helicase RecG
MKPKDIADLIATGEGFHLELKEAVDKSFLEEVCAFANSGGGKIIVGVSDNGVITGCSTDNRSRSLLQDALRSLQPNLDIAIDVVDSLFVITVPEGNDKPYACPKGFYIRNGANSQKLARNEIVELFQKEGRIHFDELRNDKAVLKMILTKKLLLLFYQWRVSVKPLIK